MADQNVHKGTPSSTMGDSQLLSNLIAMLSNGQGQEVTMMVQEAISKVIPSPNMPFSASGSMQEDVSRITPTRLQSINKDNHATPSTSKLANLHTTMTTNDQYHNTPSTTNMDHLSMPTTIRSTSQFRNNFSNVGSVRILPPTTKQVSLRSLIESQERILRLLSNAPENDHIRKELLEQIQIWEMELLESEGLCSDEMEINDNVIHLPIVKSASTPKTPTVSLVTTKGLKEVTILLTSEGNVLKDEMGLKLYHFIFRRAEQLFGNTIQVDWRKQLQVRKDELFNDVITTFGNPGFNKEIILDIARKYIHSKRDNIRSKLTKDLRYPRPYWITDQTTWDELIKDAKFKRKCHNNPNYIPSAREGGKRRLRDTTKATKARVSSIGSHKLGSGGYNSIRGNLVHQFEKEASEEDLKYALLHGSRGLQKHMLDRGEKLITGHTSDDQQPNSLEEGYMSENEEILEVHDEMFVAHNESISILEPRQETILQFQQSGEKDNEHATSTIRVVPRRKRTKRNRIDNNDL